MSVSVYYDIPAATAVMKELYDGQGIQNLVYKKNPFWALMPKNTNFVGKYKPIPTIWSNAQGRSTNFQTAQSNQTAVQSIEFLLKRVKNYQVYTIDHETLLASNSDKGAFASAIKMQADSALRNLENSMASDLFRSGTGSIGGISAITSGVITLSNAGDVVQFEVNMPLQAAATDGGTPRAAGGFVIAVNRDFVAPTVTVSATLGGAAGTPSGWAPGDFLLGTGDSNGKMSGLAAWLPTAAPTSGDNFFGVDRSVDPVRLAGLRYDGSGQGLEECLIDVSAYLAREGGCPNYFITNFATFAALEKSLGTKVQFSDLKMGEIGFKGIAINGANSTITVLADRSCQPKQGWLLQMDTWALESLNEAPHVLDYGDGTILRVYNQDAAEGRFGAYSNVSCNAPGLNANVKLAQ